MLQVFVAKVCVVRSFGSADHFCTFPVDFDRHLLLPVLKADLVRYLLVFTFGGVYTDTDTICLKPIRNWGDGKPDISLIVGVEADAKDIPDWEKSYGRQLQMVQWTFAAAPGHPVLANTFFR